MTEAFTSDKADVREDSSTAALERGVYFAPSQFEAGFLSLAHTAEDLAKVADIAADVLAKLG